MLNEDLLASFFGGIAAAITDIREKVVEEPTYGRTLSGPHWPEARETQQSMDTFYSVACDRELER